MLLYVYIIQCMCRKLLLIDWIAKNDKSLIWNFLNQAASRLKLYRRMSDDKRNKICLLQLIV